MRSLSIFKAAAILGIIILLTIILIYGKPFLIPGAFAGVLSILLLPVVKWFQKKGLGKAVSILLTLVMLIAAIALLISLISWQVGDLAQNASKIEQQVTQKIQQAQQFIAQKFGITPQQQQQIIKEQQSSSPGKMSTFIMNFLNYTGSLLANLLLVLVYIFLFIYFRERIKGFIIRLIPDEQRDNGLATINQSGQVVQSYLTGLMLMIMSLWVMYGIGFTVVGVKNALFFAILCGILEIVPFIGNITGTAFTLAMSLIQGGGANMIIGILIVYATVQFIQTYLLEPLIVGAQVHLNGMATIISLVAGELLWGIAGMILAIPLMGIVKIICDHVPGLRPFALLIGGDERKDSGFRKKIKQFRGKVLKKFGRE
jgi:predicted PurR-regulated permease PerM